MTAPQTRGPDPLGPRMAIYPHAAERHRVDPSRAGKDQDYRDGYLDGSRAARRGLNPGQQSAAGMHFGNGGKPPRKTGCPLLLLMLPLLPLWLAMAWWRRRVDPPPEWPPPHSRRKTPPPRRDLSDAAEHYAREARKARKRAEGFDLGDPVRKRNHHNPPKEK